jgi:peptidoglycan-associated lipoprotein
MHGPRTTVIRVLPILALALCLVGCPKRPGLTAASAPAPSGPAATAGAPLAVRASNPARSAEEIPATAAPAPGTRTGSRPSRPSEFAATEHLQDAHFGFDKYDIRPGDARILDADAAWLKTNTDLVLVEGHCDERGTDEYNLALGERRARATMRYLVGQGVQAGRIAVVSYGKERPLCTQHDESCWARNRRAHLLAKAG